MASSKSIQPDMTIETILTEWPATSVIFKQYHLACVGCSLTPFCTIREMATLYKVAEDEFMAALQNVIDKHESKV
jgi:hybrid cluster-associated redox disulfide protein